MLDEKLYYHIRKWNLHSYYENTFRRLHLKLTLTKLCIFVCM